MPNFTDLISSIGLIIVINRITTVSYAGRGRLRKAISTSSTTVGYGSGSIIDGSLNGVQLRNQNHSSRPLVVSVAHMIPNPVSGSTMTTEYYFKIFESNTKISNIYKINLLTYNKGIDLCLFEFLDETPVNPVCLQWADPIDVDAGDPCFVLGFPIGDSQMSIVEGMVRDPTYCFTNFGSGVDQIYHSAPTTGGNSGSCILDSSGQIIGIHSWGKPGYENFTGGPSVKSAKPILGHMLSNLHLRVEKYHPRVVLGINGKIVDDIFRIQNFNLRNVLKHIDGILVQNILPNQTIFQNNLQNNNKIEVNDIITTINGKDVGYSYDSPLNVLFTAPLTNSITVVIRKPPYGPSNIFTITLSNPTISNINQDTFMLNII
jgi:S1-C subfamily serine protease